MNVQADWSFLGDLAFRKFPLYQMKWDTEIDLLSSYVVGCRFGGPIVVFPLIGSESAPNKASQSNKFNFSPSSNKSYYYESTEHVKTKCPIPFKPKFIIYSSSGNRISVGQSRGINIVLADWTHDQMLLLLQSDGTILVYDNSGILQRELRIDMSTIGPNSSIVDAQLVTPQHKTTSIVFVCKKFVSTSKDSQPKFYYCQNIPLSDSDSHLSMLKSRSSLELPTVATSKLTDITIPPSTAFCWSVMTKQSSAEPPAGASINVLLTHGRSVYILEDSHISSSPSQIPLNTRGPIQTAAMATAPPVVNIAVSFESSRVAFLASSGRIVVLSICLDDQNRFVETRLREFDARTTSIQAPDYLVWCGLEAVCAVWRNNMVLIGLQRDYQTYTVDCAKILVDEIDCVRIVSSKSHEMLAQVAPVNNEIFRVATMSSGAILVQAYKDHKKRDLRSYEAIQIIREREELNSAVLKCIQAAGNEYEADYQRLLLNAAHFGKTFVPSIAISEYPAMCRNLRVLNVLRSKGIPLTFPQLEYLTVDSLIDELMNMERFELAVWISNWLKVPTSKGLARVLSSWAYSRLRKTHLSDDQISEEINKSLGPNPVISYADIANKAVEYNRIYLALKLIENEAQSSKQIPLLLSLKEFDVVFPRAVESCDSNLIYMSIFNLMESTKDEGRFMTQLRKHSKALNYYTNFLLHANLQKLKLILHSSRRFDDEAKVYVNQSHRLESKATKNHYLDQIDSALNVCKLCDKNQGEFLAKQVELRLKLVKFQFSLSNLAPPPKLPASKLDVGAAQAPFDNLWVDLSATQTIINLLILRETGKARECEKIAGVSDKKFDVLRQIAAGSLKPLPAPVIDSV